MDKLILFYEIGVISISSIIFANYNEQPGNKYSLFIRTLLPNRCSFV